MLARTTPWSDRLCFDIALALEGTGDPTNEIIARYDISPVEFLKISKEKLFQEKVGHYRNEIREKGLTFRLKARAQAEELLETSYLLIHDRDVSPAVKADLIKSTVKWAGLEPSPRDIESGSSSGVSITINLGDSANNQLPIKLIDVEPRLVEHESEL